MKRLIPPFLFAFYLWSFGSAMAAPDNDDFSNRAVIPQAGGAFQVYQFDASREALEPPHAEAPEMGYASVWWTWTAPDDGSFTIGGDWLEYAPSLWAAVYTGTQVSELSLVAGLHLQKYQHLMVHVRKGDVYQIAISTPSEREPDWNLGRVTDLHLRFYPPPSNDAFANRLPLKGSILELAGYTVGATRESGEPPHADFPLDNSVWWEWTPPASGIVFVRDSSSFFGLLHPYVGSQLDQLRSVPTSDDRGRFEVNQGETIEIAVMPYAESLAGPFALGLVLSTMDIIPPQVDWPDDEQGNVTLQMTNVPPNVGRLVFWSPNRFSATVLPAATVILTNLAAGKYEVVAIGVDDASADQFYTHSVNLIVGNGSDSFAQAREIGGRTEVGGDFTTATTEAGEPALPNNSTETIWWRWTAPAEGRVQMETAGASYVSRDVFTGTTLGDLQLVHYENGAESSYPSCVFIAQAGRTYWLRLYRNGGDWGSTRFLFLPRITNDDFEKAETFTDDSVKLVLQRGAVTCQAGEPGPYGTEAGSRWYQFIPPANGKIWANLEGWFSVENRTSLSIYTGQSLGSLVEVSGQQNSSPVQVVGGKRYYFRVQTPNPYAEPVSITLNVDFVPSPTNDDVANAILISSSSDGVILGSCDLATTEPGQVPYVSGGGSVWYRFVAPEDGAFAVRVSSTETNIEPYPPQLRFVAGANASSLTGVDQFWLGDIAAVSLRANQEVLFSVWNNAPDFFRRSGFILEHFFRPRPANDDFSNRTLLEGSSVSTTACLWNATGESEPAYHSVSGNRSVWWEWIAPVTGTLNVRAVGGALSVFSGTNLNELVEVPSSVMALPVFSGTQIPVESGRSYLLRLSEQDYHSVGNPFNSTGALATASLKMRLSTLRLISPTNQSVFPSETAVELEMAPFDPEIDGEISSATFARVTNELGHNKILELATVTAPSFRPIVTDFFPALHDVLVFATNSLGEILVSQPSRIRVAPNNDNFTNAIPLVGGNLDVRTIVSGASVETNEFRLGQGIGSVWYQWQSSRSGPVRISVPYYFGATVYTGTALTNLKAISFNGESFDAGPETNYFIRVTGFANEVGVFTTSVLRIRQTTVSVESPPDQTSFAYGQPVPIRVWTTEPPDRLTEISVRLGTNDQITLSPPLFEYAWNNAPPGAHKIVFEGLYTNGEQALSVTKTIFVSTPNDFFTNRVVVPLVSGEISGAILGATSEETTNGFPDVWYQWTAPGDGLLSVQLRNISGINAIRLHVGDDLNNLVEVTNRIAFSYFESMGEWLVRSNVTYVLSVIAASQPIIGGNFTLNFDFDPLAANDAFLDSSLLSGWQGQVDGNAALATLEAGEPAYLASFTPAASIWWTWTPPADGILEISYPLHNAEIQTVRPWTGSALTALSPVPLLQDIPYFYSGPAYYRVEKGVPLQISLALPAGNYRRLPWAWRLLSIPANDNFDDRTVIQGNGASVTGTTLGATRQPDESVFNGAASTWWTWTSDQDADLWINVTNTGDPLRVVIFRGTNFTTLQLMAFAASQAPFRFSVRAGESYQIMVGTERLPGADYQMSLALKSGVPPNDVFAAAQPLVPGEDQILADNRRATREFGEPNHAGYFGGRSLWYSWTAEENGTLELSVSDANYLLLAAYLGGSVTNLVEVASSFVEREGSLRFPVQAGEKYMLALDNAWGYGDETVIRFGETQLRIAFAATSIRPKLSIRQDETGSLILTAKDQKSAVLETSTDLIEWTPFEEPIVAPSTWKLESDSETARFFRLRKSISN